MITNVYSHIFDEDKRLNAQRFERDTLYQQKKTLVVNEATVKPALITLPAKDSQVITEEALLNYMIQSTGFLQKF